ncbi:unnamed protein product [Linum trigynum]|uniref:Uncharacterized protein n=1 Tax=Linum trigynum TaxID=586398 RepID=A0AAV2ETD5_9ROSI
MSDVNEFRDRQAVVRWVLEHSHGMCLSGFSLFPSPANQLCYGTNIRLPLRFVPPGLGYVGIWRIAEEAVMDQTGAQFF